MVHMPHLFGKSGSKAAATPKTLTPSGSEKDFDLGQTAEKVSNEQDHHHGHGFFHLPHFHLPHFGRHKAHESHMEKHAAAAAAPSEAEGGTALASPRSATAKPPSAARGNDSDRIHLDDSHHSHLSRSDALGGSSADSLKSNDNAALRSAQRQVGVGPGAEAPKRRLSHAHAIGHEHDPIEDSQALARQPAGGNKLRSVESIRHAQQATGIGAHAHDHESALRRAHAMHVHRNEDGSVMDEASAALVASLHAAQERKDVQVALEMHAREEARENARLARVNRGLDWDERFREDGSVSLPLMDRDKVPNMKNMAAIENVPFFDPAWIDPQPLLDWITGKSVPTGPAIPGLILGDSTHASVGLHLMQDTEGEYVVTRVEPGGPAALSGGVQLGDTIKAVNGTPLRGLPREQMAEVVRGPPGTQAVLLVQHTARNSLEVSPVALARALPDAPAAGPSPKAAPPREPAAIEAAGGGVDRAADLERENERLRAMLRGAPAPEPPPHEEAWGFGFDTLTSRVASEARRTAADLPLDIEAKGFLDVEVVEARHIPQQTLLDSADTYVRVQGHGQETRTPLVQKSLAPVWRHTQPLMVMDAHAVHSQYGVLLPDELSLVLMEQQSVGPDKAIGCVMFPIEDLCGGLESRGVGEGWYEVQTPNAAGDLVAVRDREGRVCELFLRLSYSSAPSAQAVKEQARRYSVANPEDRAVKSHLPPLVPDPIASNGPLSGPSPQQSRRDSYAAPAPEPHTLRDDFPSTHIDSLLRGDLPHSQKLLPLSAQGTASQPSSPQRIAAPLESTTGLVSKGGSGLAELGSLSSTPRGATLLASTSPRGHLTAGKPTGTPAGSRLPSSPDQALAPSVSQSRTPMKSPFSYPIVPGVAHAARS